MDNENQYTQKLKNLEDTYEQEKKTIEKQKEEVLHEKKQFILAMEDVIERARYTLLSQENQHSQELGQVYQLVEQAQEEGLNLVKKAVQKIDIEAEEVHQEYKRKVIIYEDEQMTTKKEG